MTPSLAQARLDVRGFEAKDDQSRDLLETIGRSFLLGYRHAAAAKDPRDAEGPLEEFPAQFRGFAYEGAAMALALLDAAGAGRARRVERFLTGRADRHVYMVHVGVGWALARLPRWRWRAVLPRDPLLGWLALDGYGFHQTYFHTRRYVHEQHRDDNLPWPHDRGRGYVGRAVDQGIGRALWFVGSADPARVADLIDRFAEDRRDDLYSGAGLAATYAGGADADELRAFLARAGERWPVVAQGSAFAAEARVRAGLTTAHTGLATGILCGGTPARAAAMTGEALAGLSDDGPVPEYELWRRRLAGAFVSTGGVGGWRP